MAQITTCSRRMVLVVTKHSVEYVTTAVHSVCRLKNDLYGLKHAPRACFDTIDNFLTSLIFTNNNVDPNLYFKVVGDGPVILLLYVDDLFLTRVEKLISECKRKKKN
jgi:hypothetical protein